MGTVYLALDRRHGRQVALKVLPREVADALGPERFLREIGIVARLSHPHILPLYDSGRAGGLLYYVLPYIAGGSLADRLKNGPPLPVSEVLALAGEIADALAHAHSHGVLHRDVKPDNILLHEGHALLADFGVARSAGDGLRTDSGLAVGTAGYASPEQAAGGPGLDERSDVYGLGCVLYEMLAGPAPAGRELLARRFAEPLPRLTALRPEVPGWVDGVVARALAGRPEQRYASAAVLRDALAGPGVDQEVAGTRTATKDRPRPAPWMLAGAAALLVVAAALAFLPGRLAHTEPGRVVVSGFENRTGDPSLAPIGDIAADYIARGLASTQLLQDVYDARATARGAGQSPQVGIAAGRDLARRVGAGTVLGGNYYREGDSLHFEAQLVDASTGRLILALQPVAGPLREQTRVIELLRQRVMAGFAVALQPGFAEWRSAGVPPTYAAYQAMLVASDDVWVFKPVEAIPFLRRAIAADSTYAAPKAQLAYALGTLGECREVDSISASLNDASDQLLPGDRGSLAYAQALCRRDRPAQLAAAKAVLRAVPHSIAYTVLGGIDAIELGRPREGMQILQQFDARHVPMSEQQAEIYWSFVGYAEHDLAMIRQEENGGRIPRGSVLARLGDSAAVRRHLEESILHPNPPELLGDQCEVMELRAHGSPSASAALLERMAVARGPAAAGEVGDTPCLWNLYSPHYYAGRLDEARAAYERHVAADTADVKAHAALAAIAARRGDTAVVEREQSWLRAHKEPLAFLGRARIAVLEGHAAEAVSLVGEALARDLERHFLHLDPDLEPLRNYPPFRELMRFRG